MLKWKERTFVVTADHFLADSFNAGISLNQLSILFSSPDGFFSTAMNASEARRLLTNPPPQKAAKPVDLKVLDVFRMNDSVRDVAAIQIDPSIVPDHAAVYALDQHHTEPARVGEAAVLVGLADTVSYSFLDDEGGLCVNAGYATMLLPVRHEKLQRDQVWPCLLV